MLGLASHLKVRETPTCQLWRHNSPTFNDAQTFPDNEVRKGELTMQLKKLRQTQDHLVWPADSNDLPVISWDSFQKQAEARPLVAIAGFIHDLSDFMDEHPGGRHLLAKNLGKDATTAFFGGVYDHSNAAHNVSHLSSLRESAYETCADVLRTVFSCLL